MSEAAALRVVCEEAAALCIRLRSSAINEPPLFDGPYLKDINDSAPLIWAMRQMREVMRTPPLARYVREELRRVGSAGLLMPQLPALASWDRLELRPRTRDEPLSRSRPNARMWCGREARPK